MREIMSNPRHDHEKMFFFCFVFLWQLFGSAFHILIVVPSHKASLCDRGQPANANQMTGPRCEVSLPVLAGSSQSKSHAGGN